MRLPARGSVRTGMLRCALGLLVALAAACGTPHRALPDAPDQPGDGGGGGDGDATDGDGGPGDGGLGDGGGGGLGDGGGERPPMARS